MDGCGKIQDCMNNKTEVITPPHLISSMVAGFNMVANHITIILFPAILDLFLWFGPHLRIRDLFLPAVNEMLKTMAETNATQLKDYIGPIKEMQLTLLDRLNIFSFLRTFPIGIPSLLSSSLDTLKTPLGASTIFEVQSFSAFIGIWLGLAVIGIIAGSLYFYQASRIGSMPLPEFSTSEALRQWGQMLLMTGILIIILTILIIPLSLLFTTVTMLSPVIAQIVILVLSFLFLWLLLPLIFSIHGIFALKQNFLISAITSIRLVRFFLPGAGFFILVSVFIYQGMGMIWTLAPIDSWMTLVGIFGHAFIASGLLVASFIYYNGGIKWMEDNLRRLAQSQIQKNPETVEQHQ